MSKLKHRIKADLLNEHIYQNDFYKHDFII